MKCNEAPCDIAKVKGLGTRWHLLLTLYYLAVSYLLISFYRHQIDADGTSYISLAQKYLHGDLANAVNGHWAPMVSWLIAPFIWIGLEPMMAFRTASVMVGIATLIGINNLLETLETRRFTRAVYLVALTPAVAWYAENDIGADLLCACILVHYIHATVRNEYRSVRSAGMIAGVLGAMSYLAKNYNFYFFLLHFACLNAWYWKEARGKNEKKTLLINFCSGIAVFILISGFWIGLLSTKYHTVTVGTAGAYNISLIRPGSPGHPMATDGIMPPPNASAMCVWEDPNCINLAHWTPLQSTFDFLYFLKLIEGNILKYLSGLGANYVFDATLAFLFVLAFLSKRPLHPKVRYILLTIFLYPLGYFLLYYDGQRYVLINCLLLYALSAYCLDTLLFHYKKWDCYRYRAGLLVCVSLIALTGVRMARDYRDHVRALDEMYSVSTEMKKYYDMSNVNVASQGGDWNQTLDLCYFVSARYFGKVKEAESDPDLRRDLLTNHIKYYLVYGSLKNHLKLLKPERHFTLPAGELSVYEVTQVRN